MSNESVGDTAQSSGDIDLSCQECGASELNTIPVWKDKSDYENRESPDYVGCEVCGIMRPLNSEPSQGVNDAE